MLVPSPPQIEVAQTNPFQVLTVCTNYWHFEVTCRIAQAFPFSHPTPDQVKEILETGNCALMWMWNRS